MPIIGRAGDVLGTFGTYYRTRRAPTDTEIIAHLIEEHYDGDLLEATRLAFNELEGHFAFVAIHRDHPGLLVGARHQCPLVVGIGAGETFLASNAAAIALLWHDVHRPPESLPVLLRARPV